MGFSIRQKTKNTDRVAFLALCLGAVSFGLRFVVFKQNRLVQGKGIFLWEVMTVFELFLLAFPWLVAVILTLSAKHLRRPYFISFSYGILGNLALVLLFFLVGRAGRSLITPDNPFARTSFGIGSWTMAFACYLLIVSSLKRVSGLKTAKIIISFSGMAILLFLMMAGFLDEVSILKEFSVRKDRFLKEFSRHVFLSSTAVLSATIIGIPLGILSFRNRRIERPIFFFVNIVQTIPSLALFGLMIAPLSMLSQRFPLLREMGIKGIGPAPALMALTFYALLPITRNSYTSLAVLDPAIIESAHGMGMSKAQLFMRIELPLSLPILLSGIRTSAVQAIGNTTVAALIGAGGFGVFIFQGLGQAAPDLILLGALPVILLAVVSDKLMQLGITAITPQGMRYQIGGKE